MPARRERSISITIFLLKKTITDYADALDPETHVDAVPFSDDAPFEGAFYVKDEAPKAPSWLGLVRPLVGDRLTNLRSLSTAAVLFVKSGGRIFAVTFGYGRSLLNPSSYERDFGMRVAVNRVNPDSLRSIDVRNYDEMVLSTRKQTSRSTSLNTFGLDVYKDLLKAVVGTPTDQSFARRVSGADSVTLLCPLQIEDLPDKCRACLVAYKDNKYKTSFGWIDHLELVRDPVVIAKLEAALLQELKDNADGGDVYLAPAEIEDWDDIDKFDYSGRGTRKNEGFDDIDIVDYLASLDEGRDQLTIDKLKSHAVKVKRAGSVDFEARWPVFNCLVWEGKVGRHRYALYDQKWFKIDDDFNKEVEYTITAIPKPAFSLPSSTEKESEEDYNARVARNGDYALLDQKCVTLPGAGSPIEICDVFSRQGHFIHIKRKTRSATLSHLFAQGTVSGDLFLGNVEFRRQMRAKLARKTQHAALATDKRPTVARFEVSYIVIAKPGKRRALPFFSKVNLKQAYQRLTTLGYKVSFGFVDAL